MAIVYQADGTIRSIFPRQHGWSHQDIEGFLGGSVFYRVEQTSLFAYRLNSGRLGLPENRHITGFPACAWGDVFACSYAEIGFEIRELDPELHIL